MCRFIKRITCFAVTALIVFFVIALWSGGEKFRWLGEKIGGAIKESGEKLGRRADEIKKTENEAANKIKKLTGAEDHPPAPPASGGAGEKPQTASRTPAKKTKDAEDSNSLHEMWKHLREKIGTLIKGAA